MRGSLVLAVSLACSSAPSSSDGGGTDGSTDAAADDAVADVVNDVNVACGTPVFASDWAAATGSADATLEDNGKWMTLVGGAPNSILAVVDAASAQLADAPTKNVLRVAHQSGMAGQTDVQGAWSVPAIGASLYFRVWMRNDIADDEGALVDVNSHHPVESAFGADTGTGYQWNFASNDDGTFPWLFWTNDGASTDTRWKPFANNAWAYLPKRAFHRFEWKLTRAAASSYVLDLRIYDAASKLLFDASSIRDNTLASTLAGYGPIPVADSEIVKLAVGTNGSTILSGLKRVEYTYYAAVAVCTDDWCGGC